MSTIEEQILKENPAWFAEFLADFLRTDVAYRDFRERYNAEVEELREKYPEKMFEVAKRNGYIVEANGSYFVPTELEKRRKLHDFVSNNCLMPEVPPSENYKRGMELLHKDPEAALKFFKLAECEYRTTFNERPSLQLNNILDAKKKAQGLIK